MFRIDLQGFVDDKNLAKLHWALNGLVYDMKLNSQPVANAAKGKGAQIVDATGGGDIIDVLKKYLKQHKMTNIDANGVREFQRHVGRSPNGYSAVLAKAQDAGVLKKAGKGHKVGYHVVGAK